MYTVTDTTSWYSSFARPEAHITSAKSRLKIYDSKSIYLKDKSNFEIELYNPTTIRYMAKIWINGKLVSKSGLIINPSQRVYLERFIDENAKFVFKTFEVDDVEETQGAREKNGLIKVEFYPEIIKLNLPVILKTPVFFDGSFGSPYSGGFEYSSTSFYSSTSYEGPNARSRGFGKKLLRETKPDSVETGRIAQGEKSDQKFINTSGEFAKTSYYTYEVQLLPESLKAIEANEIRNYCGECGVRIKKSNWKFCPNCGEKL